MYIYIYIHTFGSPDTYIYIHAVSDSITPCLSPCTMVNNQQVTRRQDTPTEKTPPAPTHTRARQDPQTKTSHTHLTTLNGGATTVRATSHARVGGRAEVSRIRRSASNVTRYESQYGYACTCIGVTQTSALGDAPSYVNQSIDRRLVFGLGLA